MPKNWSKKNEEKLKVYLAKETKDVKEPDKRDKNTSSESRPNQ